MRFRTTILQNDKTATGIRVPDEVVASLGAGKRPKVTVTINGYTYRSSVATVDGRFMVGVSATVREGCRRRGRRHGRCRHRTRHRASRSWTVPARPRGGPEARAGRGSGSSTGSPTATSEWHVLSVGGAKTPETRQRRIDKSVGMLREGRAR